MAKTVSVIVPVYNVSKYLDQCIGSLLKQSYKDQEIILVNDGSTDKSFLICEEYRKKDPRIRLISQENAGLSAARNRGIEAAGGDYLCFLDSDDWLEENFLERMVSVHEETGSDVTICNYKAFDEEKSVVYVYQSFEEKYVKEFTPSEWFRNIYGNGDFSTNFVVAWGKLYNRSLFENIRYPLGKIAEDDYTTYFAYLLSEKIAYIHEPLYIYRKTPTGISKTKPLMERLPLQSIEEEFTLATLAEDIDTSSIRKIYLERLRILRDWCLFAGRAEDYRHICLKIEVLKKHGIEVEQHP